MKAQADFPIGKVIVVSIILLVLASAAMNSIAVISAGHRGVLLTWGKVENRILDEGISFITPFMNQVVVMSVQTEKYSTEASSASSDLQIVSTEVTVNYRIKSERVNYVYQQLSMDFEDRVIQPAVQEVVKASTAQFTAEQLITQRPMVKSVIEESLKEKLSMISENSLEVQSVSITDFDFSPQFNTAIEAKVTAEQQALKADRDLQRIKIEAEQKIAMAQAEAKSIEIQSKALRDNPDILRLRWIEKWNGLLPQFLSTGAEGNDLILSLPTGTEVS